MEAISVARQKAVTSSAPYIAFSASSPAQNLLLSPNMYWSVWSTVRISRYTPLLAPETMLEIEWTIHYTAHHTYYYFTRDHHQGHGLVPDLLIFEVHSDQGSPISQVNSHWKSPHRDERIRKVPFCITMTYLPEQAHSQHHECIITIVVIMIESIIRCSCHSWFMMQMLTWLFDMVGLTRTSHTLHRQSKS